MYDLEILNFKDEDLDVAALLSNRSKLRAAAGVLYFLGDENPIENSVPELEKRVNLIGCDSRPVFFFDEAIPTESSTINKNILRYARNLLRAANLVVVLMGTDSTASNMLSAVRDSRGEEMLRLWCKLVTRLPRLTEETAWILGFWSAMEKLKDHTALCTFLKSQYSTCLPWLIKLVCSAVDEISEAQLHVNSETVMSMILCRVARKLFNAKVGLQNRDGLRGQYVRTLVHMYT